jgi:hypothetical protein
MRNGEGPNFNDSSASGGPSGRSHQDESASISGELAELPEAQRVFVEAVIDLVRMAGESPEAIDAGGRLADSVKRLMKHPPAVDFGNN